MHSPISVWGAGIVFVWDLLLSVAIDPSAARQSFARWLVQVCRSPVAFNEDCQRQ
jgi:hypothetical protein